MSARPTVRVPLLAVVLESVGTLTLALGIGILLAPGMLSTVLPAAILTPAVGWTAVAVGALVSLLGAWQLVTQLRRRGAEATRR